MSNTLGPWPVVQNGSQGHPIRTLKFLLRARGHNLAVDGIFGSVTEAAVKAFQTGKGMTADVLISAYPNNMPLTNRLPSDRTNNPIHCDRWNVERQSMLETSDRAIRLRSKDSIHREPFTRFARTELEFLLDAANRVARITLFHLNYQSRPRLRNHHPITTEFGFTEACDGRT